MDLVSVIIPAFNAESFIRETIQSILDQSHKNIEIIVVNDGSTDKTEDIILSFNDKRLRYFYQSNSGSPKAKNLGLKKARGVYVQFLDSDDILSIDKIENQVKILEERPNAITWCSTFKFDKTDIAGKSKIENIDLEILYKITTPLDFLLSLNGSVGRVGMVQPNAYLTRLSTICKSGNWNESLNRSPDDDSEFFARVILCSSEVLYDEKSMNFYRKSGLNSLSKKKDLLHAFGALETIIIKFNVIKQYLNDEKVDKLFATHLSLCAYEYGVEYPVIINKVEHEIKKLGFSNIMPVGGKRFSTFAKIFSFKYAIQLKRYLGNCL